MCLDGMSPESEEEVPPPDTIEKIVERWLDEKFLDGVHRKFSIQFSGQLDDADVEDAIARVIEKMLRNPSPVALRNPEGYFFTSVRNTLRNALRRLIPGELPEDESGEAERLARRQVTPEEQALAADLLEMVRRHINLWKNRNMAVVTLTYIEAAYYGEPIDPEYVQQVVLDTTGEEIIRSNVSTLLNRGRARLIDQLTPTIRPDKEDDDD